MAKRQEVTVCADKIKRLIKSKVDFISRSFLMESWLEKSHQKILVCPFAEEQMVQTILSWTDT